MEVSMDKKGWFTKEFDRLLQDDARFVVTSKTLYDDGNEEYIGLLIDYKEYIENTDDFKTEIAAITGMLEEILELPQFDQDHACTLENVTHGNSTIIALITCCK
jgi:hypothetical protein